METKKGFAYESVLLLVVFGILLHMGMGSYFEHRLDYPIPRGFMAADSFYKYDRSAYLDRTGDNKYEPPFMVGGLKGIKQTYPYLTFHNPVLLKDISGLELYNSYFFMSVFYTILGGLLGYVLVRRYNKKVALLSTGILGFLFIKNFYIGFVFGWAPLIFGSMLLVLIFWIMLNFDLKESHILLGIIMAASFLTHPSETVLGIFIAAILFTPKLIKEKLNPRLIKKALISAVIIIVLSAYYFPMFYKDYVSISGSSTTIQFGPAPKAFPVPYFSDMGVYGWLVALGFVVLVAIMITKKMKDWENFVLLAVMGFITFSVSFLAIGGHRAYQNRFFWPVYLGILFGLGVYSVIKIIPVRITLLYYALPIMLLAASAYFYFEPIQSNGLIANREMWDGMQWVSKNVGEQEKALVFYGDSYNQQGILTMFGLDRIYFTDINYLPNKPGYLQGYNYSYDESISKIQTGTITRNFSIKLYSHYMANYGKLGFSEEIVNNGGFDRNADICSFDYVIIDKISRFQELMDYNQKLRKRLLESGHIKEVFANSWYNILKNEKPGEECI